MTTDSDRRFSEVYEANWRALLGYAVRRTDSAEEAADVVAETFLVAWRRRDVVPAEGQARLWLYGVARRVLANQRRGAVRRNRLGERLQQHLTSVPCEGWQEASETRNVVSLAMDRLDDDDRELLRLASWEGLSPTEIAVAAGVPAATVRTRLHRARHRLRHELAGLGWPDERSAPTGHVEADEGPLVVTPEK
ncbi:MAG: RNA polymerase sigma factor, partial [Acidimicrobiia bacterium]|nr:RNA polymerase sigma factor [Acidimicrobiia bacterium]